jgi:putative peptidoglycan lipid II flippase
LTGVSRVAGLIREVVAAGYYGTQPVMSAFTLAFQVPNLVRALFADSALSAAFVPVFTRCSRRTAPRGRPPGRIPLRLILAVLGALTALFILVAPAVMPLFTGGDVPESLDDVTVGLSQLLFPIVVLLGLNGLLVGILNAYDHFTVPALSPVIWNLVIIVALVGLQGVLDEGDEIYAYAIGVLVGTAVQLAMAFPALRRVGFRIRPNVAWRSPEIRRILVLMLPVTIGLGLINFNLLINTTVGFLVSDEAPAAIDRAFRIYMLPQGIFSVAIATVLFPALSRLAARGDTGGLREQVAGGTRLILVLLLPAAAATLVLAEPITRVVYERGAFDAESTEQVSEALFWFGFSLPFSGINLLLTRTFFSLQRPWTPTVLAGVTLIVTAAVSLALYGPLGIGGVVAGTVAGTIAMTVLQAEYLRRITGGLDLGRGLRTAGIAVLGSVLLAAVALGTHRALEALLGDGLIAQVIAVGTALTAGGAAYAAAMALAGVPEARRLTGVLGGRLRGGA